VLALLGAFLFPLLVFTNVHTVHNYYQAANGIFLIMAAAIVVGSMMGGRRWLAALVMTLFLIVIVVLPIALLALTIADSVTPAVDKMREFFAAGLPSAGLARQHSADRRLSR
jgi:F0F1-type ATP synthase membrane subunit a